MSNASSMVARQGVAPLLIAVLGGAMLAWSAPSLVVGLALAGGLLVVAAGASWWERRRLKAALEPLLAKAGKYRLIRLAEAKIVAGSPAPDFTLKTADDKNFTLSSLRGKYVVLDFWGSWCGWCIKGIPKMKRYYDRYKSKTNVLPLVLQANALRIRFSLERSPR